MSASLSRTIVAAFLLVQALPPHTQDLSIEFSTYLGGGSFDAGAAIAADADGNVYVAGNSQSRDFGESPGLPPAEAWLPTTRAFVTKFDPSLGVAHSIVDSVTLNDIDVDAGGNVYIAGSGAGSGEALVVQLDRSGRTLRRISLGGSAFDFATGVAVDGSGNIIVAGSTASSDFQGADATCTGASSVVTPKAFVAKLDSSGRLLRATCVGGSYADQATNVAVDAKGDIFMLGSSLSSDFPTTPGAAQRSIGGGFCGPPSGRPCGDLFLVKFNGSTFEKVFATFFGGNREETPGGLGVDAGGNAYVGGWTTSKDLRVAHAFQPGCRSSFHEADCGDGFVAKINAAGSAIVYATYLGGSRYDAVQELSVSLTAGFTWAATQDRATSLRAESRRRTSQPPRSWTRTCCSSIRQAGLSRWRSSAAAATNI
jgi:hypothetical protein